MDFFLKIKNKRKYGTIIKKSFEKKLIKYLFYDKIYKTVDKSFNLIEAIKSFKNFTNSNIRPLANSSLNDNDTYLIDGDTVFRSKIPNDEYLMHSLKNENTYLPYLQIFLKIALPKPVFFYKADEVFAYSFLLNKYIDGNHTIKDRSFLVEDLSKFFIEFHNTPVKFEKQLAPCEFNYYRGAKPEVYNKEFYSFIDKLSLDESIFTKNEMEKIVKIWENAKNTEQKLVNMWVHGDIAITNLVFKESRLIGVIDWGQMAIGDISCDLMIAYTLLDSVERKALRKKLLYLDEGLWTRAGAWTLWKSLGTLIQGKNLSFNPVSVVKEVLSDFN